MASEKQYDGVIESAPCAILVASQDGSIVTINRAAERLFGYPREELVGQSLDVLLPERMVAAHRRWREMMATDGTYSARAMAGARNVTARRSDGKEVPVEISLGEVVVDGVRMNAAFVSDVSQRLYAESVLRQSEQRYWALFEHATDAVFVTDLHGNIRECNGEAEELLGLARRDIEGMSLGGFFVAAAELGAAMGPRFRVGDACEGERLCRADGERRVVDVSPVGVEIGGEALVLSIVRDVTARNRLLEQVHLSDRMATVGTLAAGVGHEINNPLAALMANLALLAGTLASARVDDAPGSLDLGEMRAQLADAREAAERVRVIVHDLRMLSRPQDDERTHVQLHVALDSCVRMAATEVRPRARIVKDYGTVPDVHANVARLGQVFLNILINAAHAIPEGSPETNVIHLATRVDASGAVAIEFRDTGEGMEPAVLAKLFKPFFTTKAAGAGSGLGLVISQHIVTAYGGSIRVRSKRGEGSIFTVLLPPALSESRPVHDTISIASPNVRRGRVLVVDDEVASVRALGRLLGEDHDVVTESRAQAALDLITAGKCFDAILCDLMMPEMSGMDLYDAVKHTSPLQAERFIFMTGGAFTLRARAFLDEVSHPRLEKPLAVEVLRSLVNDLVGAAPQASTPLDDSKTARCVA